MYMDNMDIVKEARTWIGTQFHHQGRIKAHGNDKGGCDCIGLIIGVVRELKIPYGDDKLLCECDNTDYGRIPDGVMLEKSLSEYLQKIDVNRAGQGDILLFRFDKNPQHVGIVSDYPDDELGIIHCYAQARKVVEHRLDDNWKQRIVGAYRFKKI